MTTVAKPMIRPIIEVRTHPRWKKHQLTAKVAGETVGRVDFSINSSPGVCWIGMLSIREEHKRRGYGRFLIEQVEAIARRRGQVRISLRCAIENRVGRWFWESVGYETVEDDPDLVFWLMRKSLVKTKEESPNGPE